MRLRFDPPPPYAVRTERGTLSVTPLRPVPVKAPGRIMIAWNQRVAIWKARHS